MVFQNNTESINFPVPYKGIDVNKTTPEYAKYLENILISDNNGCEVRNGTNLVAKFPFDAARIFRNQISLMSYLKDDGTSEKIIYQNYLSQLPYLTMRSTNNITVIPLIEDLSNICRLTLDLTSLTKDKRDFIKARIYNGLYIYVKQDSLSQGADIDNVTKTDTSISFTMPFPRVFFDIELQPLPQPVLNGFDLWLERGALYKLEGAEFNTTPLKEDLDPNVIVSHVNFQGKLLIANGIDPVFVYNGNTAEELKSKVKVNPTSDIDRVKNNANQMRFSTSIRAYADLLTADLLVGTDIVIYENRHPVNKTITAIASNLSNGITTFTVTLNSDIQVTKVSSIEYKKSVPHFSFLAVAKSRLWAIGSGRTYANKFRQNNDVNDDPMTIYYADTLKTLDEWYNENASIGFIDLSTNISTPDNIEAIVEFQGKVVFIGRETTHVYSGNDPKIRTDGVRQIINFQLEKVFKVGIIQKTLFVEVPNDIIFLSKYGIVAMSSINKYRQLAVSYNFSNGVADYVKYQLEYTYTDREYRNLKAFLYPYGRFLGFKLNYSCLIYQLKENGNWAIFSGDFAKANSIFYDNVSQDLFLGMEEGALLKYADKIKDISYKDYYTDNIRWKIQYNWLTPDNTWNNEKISIGCRSLEDTDVNVSIYVNLNDSEKFSETISIVQGGGVFDISKFDTTTYAYVDRVYADEDIRFAADSIMLVLSGSVENQLKLNNIILKGGLAEAR